MYLLPEAPNKPDDSARYNLILNATDPPALTRFDVSSILVSIMEYLHIHPAAAQGYELSPEAYERGRPSYPGDAVACLCDHVKIGATATVLELGSGTGKLTRLMASRAACWIATEPVAAMRRCLKPFAGNAALVGATAEAIPVRDAATDAVVVAQAFHWFDGSVALDEIHRVLKPNGRLGLIWNVRDETDDWVHELTHILDPYAGDSPRYRMSTWKRAFDGRRDFSALQEASFTHRVACDWPTLRDRVASISFIAALPEEERDRVLRRTRSLVDQHPQTAGKATYDFPYRADVFWCRRI